MSYLQHRFDTLINTIAARLGTTEGALLESVFATLVGVFAIAVLILALVR